MGRYNTKFWGDTVERVIRTAAQTAIGAIGTTAVLQSVDWGVVGGTVATASILSLLMSLAGGSTGSEDDASFRDPADLG